MHHNSSFDTEIKANASSTDVGEIATNDITLEEFAKKLESNIAELNSMDKMTEGEKRSFEKPNFNINIYEKLSKADIPNEKLYEVIIAVIGRDYENQLDNDNIISSYFKFILDCLRLDPKNAEQMRSLVRNSEKVFEISLEEELKKYGIQSINTTKDDTNDDAAQDDEDSSDKPSNKRQKVTPRFPRQKEIAEFLPKIFYDKIEGIMSDSVHNLICVFMDLPKLSLANSMHIRNVRYNATSSAITLSFVSPIWLTGFAVKRTKFVLIDLDSDINAFITKKISIIKDVTNFSNLWVCVSKNWKFFNVKSQQYETTAITEGDKLLFCVDTIRITAKENGVFEMKTYPLQDHKTFKY